jgi:hypothetical protein
MNGEGLVNVYRGTGKILMAPTLPGAEDTSTNVPGKQQGTAKKGFFATVAEHVGD